MRILLDTHYLIWALTGSHKITPVVHDLLADRRQPVSMSIVSLWEIAIKNSLRKLELKGGVRGVLDKLPAMGFDSLPLSNEHVEQVAQLPFHHRDPFDRMLIAQAKHEGMHLLTADPHFAAYDVALVKA